jgi:hypothetical protein
MVVSYASDRFVTWLKTINVVLLFLSCVFYAWYLAICEGWVNYNTCKSTMANPFDFIPLPLHVP